MRVEGERSISDRLVVQKIFVAPFLIHFFRKESVVDVQVSQVVAFFDGELFFRLFDPILSALGRYENSLDAENGGDGEGLLAAVHFARR